MEVAYNKVFHSTICMSPFEVVYDFKSLIPLDFLPLPNINATTNEDGIVKATFVRNLNKESQGTSWKKDEKMDSKDNQGRKMKFVPEDWVWVHLKKEGFAWKRKSKLLPRGDGPFQFLKRINNNAYILDLPHGYEVSSSFNINYLSSFDVGTNLRTNSL